jgi:hypothetical protein
METVMKWIPWVLMLVLPWTVALDTTDYGDGVATHQVLAQHQLPGGEAAVVPCGDEQEACSDFVQAMNNAHNFREAAHAVPEQAPAPDTDLHPTPDQVEHQQNP